MVLNTKFMPLSSRIYSNSIHFLHLFLCVAIYYTIIDSLKTAISKKSSNPPISAVVMITNKYGMLCCRLGQGVDTNIVPSAQEQTNPLSPLSTQVPPWQGSGKHPLRAQPMRTLELPLNCTEANLLESDVGRRLWSTLMSSKHPV